MSFVERLRFLSGIMVVFLVVGALVVYLNYSMSTADSIKAELAADTSTIGTDYAGLVVKQNVNLGDRVTKDQPLFEIDSPLLKRALADKEVTVASLPFAIDPDTTNIIVKASSAGVINTINYPLGSYAPMAGIVATVNTASSLYTVSHFRLSPPDYARINRKGVVAVIFPDNSRMDASIFDVSFARNGDAVDTVVRARFKDADMNDSRFSVGTPVQVRLSLGQDTFYRRLVTFLELLFEPTAPGR